MLIRFLGAARTVTGSSHIIEVNDTRIMLDCGLFQGPRAFARNANEMTCRGDVCDRLDAVVLSHGHLDHCGRLPMLTTLAGYKGPIYCTDATAEVSRVVLADSAEIQLEDAEYLNKRTLRAGDPEVRPLYTPQDTLQTFKLFNRVKLANRFLIKDIGVTLFEAGHILGSTYVWLDFIENGVKRNVLFTADVGRYNVPIINDPVPPPGPAELLITESTYGGRKHDPVENIEPHFLELIKTIIERRSRLIIPSFALGRTQTMLWYIQKFITHGLVRSLPVFVDSPMGSELTRITLDYRDYFDAETRDLLAKQDVFGMKNVTLASSSAQSKAINAVPGPCVIIASSPTCEFGRVLHHLGHSLERPGDAVLFVGWTPPGTLGRRLQDGQKRVRIFDRFYDVKCDIRTLPGMSAHADSDELLRFLKPAVNEHTQAFVVHGEPDQSEVFAQRLVNELGVDDATVPAVETSIIL